MKISLGQFVTANLAGALGCRQGFIESVEPLVIRGESGATYQCEGKPVIVSNPPESFDPIASYAQAEAAQRAGLRVELAAVNHRGHVVKWDVPTPEQSFRNFPLSRWRIVINDNHERKLY